MIFIPKPGKKIEDPGDFRPISLIDSMGKLLEHVTVARLNEESERNALIPYRGRSYIKKWPG